MNEYSGLPVTDLTSKEICGFVGGTLVHTNMGLVPIEQLKVGDMVLSKSETGEGEQIYKPIIRIESKENSDVWLIEYTLKSKCEEAAKLFRMGSNSSSLGRKDYSFLVCSPQHLFRVDGCQWKETEVLGGYGDDVFELVDGQIPEAISANEHGMVAVPIYRTITEGIGWTMFGSEFYGEGSLIDLRNNQILPELDINKDVLNEVLGIDFYEVDYKMKHMTYDLEVADTHTYYVGDLGVWVRGLNPR